MGLQRGQVLVGDVVDLVLVSDEDVLLAALYAAFDTFPIGHLLRAVLAVLVRRFAHRITDPALVGICQEPGGREQSDCRDTCQGLSHSYLHLRLSADSLAERMASLHPVRL